MLRTRGFTLIELMIVLVIVGVFAALALPSFVQHLRKARRSDAHEAAAAVVQAQERWRADHTRFTSNLSDLGLTATSKEGHYALALSDGATATAYTLTISAARTGRQAGDTACATMTVALGDGKLTYSPSDCWSR